MLAQFVKLIKFAKLVQLSHLAQFGNFLQATTCGNIRMCIIYEISNYKEQFKTLLCRVIRL